MKRMILRSFLIVGVFAGLSVVAPTWAEIQLTVVPMYQPNGAANTPGWQGYVPNAINSLLSLAEGGSAMEGDRNADPSAVELMPKTGQGLIDPYETVVTGFPSWRGAAPGLFANERGNRAGFGLIALGDGKKVVFDTLRFELDWLGADGMGGFDTDLGLFSTQSDSFLNMNYTSTRVGIDYGGDNAIGGGDDLLTAPYGPLDPSGITALDAMVYVGVADALCPGGGNCNGDGNLTDQGNIDLAVGEKFSGPQQKVVTQYWISDPLGREFSGMNMITYVPEPSSCLLLLASLLPMVARLRRGNR